MGLALHSTLDGVALAASVLAEKSSDGRVEPWAGVVVFLVIALHKPFDSLTLGTLMAVDGRSARSRHLVNLVYALAVPLGAVLFALGAQAWFSSEQRILGPALAFAAGTFICIATSDLLPELQFHSHDRLKLSIALMLGIAMAGVMVSIEESGHQHHEPPEKHGEPPEKDGALTPRAISQVRSAWPGQSLGDASAGTESQVDD